MKFVTALSIVLAMSLSAQAKSKSAGIKKLQVTQIIFTNEDLRSNPEDIMVANHEVQQALSSRSLQEKTDQLDADLLALDVE